MPRACASARGAALRVPLVLLLPGEQGTKVLADDLDGVRGRLLAQGEEFRRARYQLIAALALLAAAGVLILAFGPYFAGRLIAEMVEAAKMR